MTAISYLWLCVFSPAPSPPTVQLSSSAETPGDLQSLLFDYLWQCCGISQCHVYLCKLQLHICKHMYILYMWKRGLWPNFTFGHIRNWWYWSWVFTLNLHFLFFSLNMHSNRQNGVVNQKSVGSLPLMCYNHNQTFVICLTSKLYLRTLCGSL